uniref:Uncharacterized protein n=1 Tax=Chromera velia CCMP2878 TaxID=1169474 RepID=A0A0G4H7M3_9ALVE|eukprot:Cvel_24967.t1-p1 / transcript=Cvel_24967.t1 / gene=Cvel_24967 / organism=Chromera_velia_CCMP2878 / gene_product=hypothetical protein / transcript_product=hypothetical protein / location=Cvel_scaffold2765:4736-5119(+) / protein_length=128 / sequence_SO=supercontig / SO=protein_coding / is_pseudo=false
MTEAMRSNPDCNTRLLTPWSEAELTVKDRERRGLWPVDFWHDHQRSTEVHRLAWHAAEVKRSRLYPFLDRDIDLFLSEDPGASWLYDSVLPTCPRFIWMLLSPRQRELARRREEREEDPVGMRWDGLS